MKTYPLMFLGGRERLHWERMGELPLLILIVLLSPFKTGIQLQKETYFQVHILTVFKILF